MDASEISDYVENDLVPSIESIEGVASVTTTGQLEESIQVTMNEDKIKALNKKIRKSIDKEFDDAQAEIDDGKNKVENGQSSLDSGKDQLSSAINQAMAKQEELEKTEKDLKKQLKELKEQQKSLKQIQSGIQSFMESEIYQGLITMIKQNPQAVELPG